MNRPGTWGADVWLTVSTETAMLPRVRPPHTQTRTRSYHPEAIAAALSGSATPALEVGVSTSQMRVIHLLYQAQVYEAQLSTNSKTDQADQITEMAEQMPCSSTGRKNLPTPGTKTSPTPIRSGASSLA